MQGMSGASILRVVTGDNHSDRAGHPGSRESPAWQFGDIEMIIAPTRPTLLTSIAFVALVGVLAIPSGSGWAADPAMTPYAASNPSGMSNQNTALDAVAQARMALKHRQARNALEQIERAERALLNIQ